jgi:hypothetical protein
MVVKIRELIDDPSFEQIQKGTTGAAAEQAAGTERTVDVADRINEILGYDIFEQTLMVEGYHEMGKEMLEIAESTAAAMYEALPPE